MGERAREGETTPGKFLCKVSMVGFFWKSQSPGGIYFKEGLCAFA